MIISAIIACCKKAGYGSSIVAPISGQIIEFMGEIYVDDTNMLVILPDAFDCNELVSKAQQSLNAGAHLLNPTGGVLNQQKCYWYLVSYEFNKGKPRRCLGCGRLHPGMTTDT
jgi:hypothetical protein